MSAIASGGPPTEFRANVPTTRAQPSEGEVEHEAAPGGPSDPHRRPWGEKAGLVSLVGDSFPHDRWIGLRRRARVPRLRLIAFPYAGGGASVYRRWLNDLDHEDWVDFVAVQLPGRENRISETPYTEIDLLLSELDSALSPQLDVPYVLFGYSMGALLAYELALRFVAVRGAVPLHLAIAARTPPYRPNARASRTAPTREELIARVRRLDGTPPSIIASRLFDEYFLPTLQADFALVDRFQRNLPQILPCPLLALGATDDSEVSVDEMQAWSMAAGRSFELKLFDGGHFFLYDAHEQVIDCINTLLGRYQNTC